MIPRPSGRLITALFVAGGSLPLTVFLFEATPGLIASVDPALLAFITGLLLLLLLLSAAVVVYICVKWLWHIAEDERYARRYQRQMLDLDLVERKLAIKERRLELEERERRANVLPTRANRSTDASIPTVMQQQRPVTRRLNAQRPDH